MVTRCWGRNYFGTRKLGSGFEFQVQPLEPTLDDPICFPWDHRGSLALGTLPIGIKHMCMNISALYNKAQSIGEQ